MENESNEEYVFDKEDWLWTMSHRRWLLRLPDPDQDEMLKDINIHIGHMLRNRGASPKKD